MDFRIRVRRSSLILAVVVAALAFPLGALAVHQFSDVPTGASYHDDVEALVDAGITSGCGDGKYCPSDPVTRAQMAQFLNRLGSLDGNTTPSVDADKVDGLDASAFVQPLFAVINSNGSLARGTGVTSSANLATGSYEVIFDRDVTSCAYVTSLGDGALGTYDGETSATNRLGDAAGVFIQTTNSAGTETNLPFHLMVMCGSNITISEAVSDPSANNQQE